MNTDFWNQRYSAEESAYGIAPNSYFKTIIDTLNPGKLLLPCEGEGRNAVYAAGIGWEVDAFDQSVEGKNRADKWAKDKGVQFNYAVCNLENMVYDESSYDAIAMIFTHFPPAVKKDYHQKLAKLLKSGGYMILEGFSKDHIDYRTKNPQAGGPGKADLMYSVDEIKELFPDFEVIELKQTEVELQEGLYHAGLSSVIRFVGKKK